MNLIYSKSENSTLNINDMRNLIFKIQDKSIVYTSFYQYDKNLSSILNDQDAIGEMYTPLFVVMLNQNETENTLMLINKIQMINRAAKWLIFMDENFNEDDDWEQNIFVPFDAEVFITPHLSNEHLNVTVQEIFRKTPAYSIEIENFGQWNYNDGLQPNNAELSLNYRRNSLGYISLQPFKLDKKN